MKVLMIEDNPEIVNVVTLTFKLRWPEAIVIPSMEGAEGIQKAKTESPDILVLDINLPDMSGFDVLKQIRLFSALPIIILSVRGSEVDQLAGLEMGADDYIVKPFSPVNLLTRVKAVLRRSVRKEEQVSTETSLILGNISINLADQEVLADNKRLHLTPTEARILFYLSKNIGKLLSQEAIAREVWGDEARYIDYSTLKRYIYQLRQKLGDDADNPRLIVNERGMGYRLLRPSVRPV
jgi:DNA-binding response OmpR family regulator